jgi:hypothetical protein
MPVVSKKAASVDAPRPHPIIPYRVHHSRGKETAMLMRMLLRATEAIRPAVRASACPSCGRTSLLDDTWGCRHCGAGRR